MDGSKSYRFRVPKNVLHGLQQLGFGEGRQVINSLIEKNVFQKSPHGTGIKFTAYGLGLFRAATGAQEKWESDTIAKISVAAHDEVMIRAGDTYLANHLLREIFSAVHKEVAVIDTYVDATFFDYLLPLA